MLNTSLIRFGAFTPAQEKRIAKAAGAAVAEPPARKAVPTVDELLARFSSDPLNAVPKKEEADPLSHLPMMPGSQAVALIDDLEKKFTQSISSSLSSSFQSLQGLFSDDKKPSLAETKQAELDGITDGLRQAEFRVPDEVVSMLEWAYEQMQKARSKD